MSSGDGSTVTGSAGLLFTASRNAARVTSSIPSIESIRCATGASITTAAGAVRARIAPSCSSLNR